MKLRLKTWQISLVLLLSALLPLCLIGSTMSKTTNAQTLAVTKNKPDDSLPTLAATCKGGHPNRKDFFKNVRMIPPSSVLEITGNRLNYAYVDSGIELGSVELENGYSVVPKDFSRENHSGCYAITFCEKHMSVLLIDQLPQEQCGTVKQ